MAPPSEPGLRERKKVRTRSTIQHHALRLFREQGYEATTVSQIAQAAEISESTFFRYFPTKEAVVFADDFDEALFEAFRAQPAEIAPIAALRRALKAAFADITDSELGDAQERTKLMFEVPEIRGAFAGQLVALIDMTSAALAERAGRQVADLEVRTLAGALLGAVIAVSFAGGEMAPDFLERIDRALAAMEKGLALSWREAAAP